MTIYINNTLHLPFLRLHERDGDIMALAHVIDQHRHVQQFLNGIFQSADIVAVGGAEIVREGFDLDLWVLGADLGSESVELGGSAGDEEEVEGGAGEVEGEFFA